MFSTTADFPIGGHRYFGLLVVGRYLSIAHKALFFQVRPDNIVTESDFFNTWKKFKDDPSHLAINITKRTRWDDGLDRGENPDEGWCTYIYLNLF